MFMRMTRKRQTWALFIVMMFGLVMAFAGHEIWFSLSPAKRGSQDSYIILVQKGETPARITKALVEQGVVADAGLFHRLGRWGRFWGRIKAGEYKLSPAMTPVEVFSVITSGISVNYPVTVHEGNNMYEIGAALETTGLVEKDYFVSLCKSRPLMMQLGYKPPLPPSLEGYLFPDTYFFNRTMTPQDMIRKMVSRFGMAWKQEYEMNAAAMGFTKHQLLTLASIIEKETGTAGERPLISSVFHNRLKKRMRLQSDPTTIYGMWERYRGNIRRDDLNERTPYNTYAISGLPIGPISNPGTAAIDAALRPAASDYLFFVSHNDGTHEFTRNFSDHAKAVRKYQLDRTARQGKSWREQYKKERVPQSYGRIAGDKR
ncbi:MAG: hypothetical protein A2583_01290 [Bdellovibrionales bacterium RIFOXYD1_FULL_53_11]|nr:MAG: hypothetical protein A2583_01290 [Bdellovibrionales bacterium RIFOXYD1_FULL_53_11]